MEVCVSELRDITTTTGGLGLTAATLYYLARALWAQTRRNGNRPATLRDVVDALKNHAHEEEAHHARNEEQLRILNENVARQTAGIERLLGRSDR